LRRGCSRRAHGVLGDGHGERNGYLGGKRREGAVRGGSGEDHTAPYRPLPPLTAGNHAIRSLVLQPTSTGTPMTSQRELATLAGGCFWCLEAIFQQLRGVDRAQSGYAGGKTKNPSYEAVCTGATGHAEVVQVTFDPAVITFRDLLDIFFTIHDPTTLNRQGNDVGTQYRSV